jgi:GAF domain-containing protein
MEHGVEAVVRLARISRELLGLPDEKATLQGIVTQAVNAVDACEAAVVSECTGKVLSTSAATSGVAEACDELQHRQRQGPSVQVVWSTEVALVGDAVRDSRWPAWGRRVSELGMSSVLAVRLAAGGPMPGSLTFYSSQPDAFDATAISMAFSYATHAGVALYAARQATGFANAVEARHMIGVAQGVLMIRYGLDLDRSFQLLRRYSNRTNTKLRDVARQVAQDGGLPQDQIPRQYLPTPTAPSDPRGEPSTDAEAPTRQ